jgi:DNA-binding GntR family transcriptional regulator
MRENAMTRADYVRHQLTAQILSGARPPGSALDEQALAEEFGASRTPVREALRLLAASGLVAHRPRRGAEVIAPSPKELNDMFQVMADLEGLCASHAAAAMTPLERRVLAETHESMAPIVRAGDLEAYANANEGFHALIYGGSHNAYLADLTLQTRQRLRPFRRAQFQSLGRLAASHAEHARIVQAIMGANRAGAIAAMTAHITDVRDAFLRVSRIEDGQTLTAMSRAG